MGTTERRQREAQQRRRAILTAARKVFWEQGYARATMEQVAVLAEVAQGTLYLYFPSKDALYAELLVEGYEVLRERLLAALGGGGGAAQRAGALIEAFLTFAREHPEYFEIIFFVLQREIAEGWRGALSEEQLARLAEKESACKQVAAALLDEIGYGPPDRREYIVEALWSMLAGVVFYLRHQDHFDEVAGEAKDLLLRAAFGGSVNS